jgi:Tfp pilus assembly protein PilO
MNSGSWYSSTLVRNERLLHCGMAALFIICAFSGIVLQNNLQHSVAAIDEERKHYTELFDSETEIRVAVDQLKQQYDELEEDYSGLLSKIPIRVVDSDVLSSMRGIAQSTQCSLIDFRPGSTQKHLDYQTKSFELHLEGKFKELFRFFEALTHVPFAYQIGSYKITESASAGGPCRLDLELKVVFDHAWGRGE